MPVRDCMSSSPFCPSNMRSKFAIPGNEAKGCDSCVEESLKNDEIPKCFFCKMEEEGPLDLIDYTVETFAKKVMDFKQKSHK